MQSANTGEIKYRADIDGLRAIAVLAVVFYHAFPNLLTGGFIGVDVFFIISGFLISSIIFEKINSNSFSFLDFYIRRIKRIFPSLLFVLITFLILGWFVLFSIEYAQLGKHATGGIGFISNFILWKEIGYFDNASETKPFLHLWSLSIEEQFYLIWPVLLTLAYKQKKMGFLFIITLLGLCSFAFNIRHSFNGDLTGAFYAPHSRFWELMMGAFLAYSTLYKPKTLNQLTAHLSPSLKNFLRNFISFLGTLMILWGSYFLNKNDVFPGWWALLPTIGAVLIVSGGQNAWVNRIILSSPLLVGIGLLSYPIYLWHWPLLSFARILESATPSITIRIVAILMTFVLSWISYKFIEKPFRFGRLNKLIISVLLGCGLTTGLIGYLIYVNSGFINRHSEAEKIVASDPWGYPGDLKPFAYRDHYFYETVVSRPTSTLFIGDSSIEQYAPRALKLAHEKNDFVNRAVFATRGGCLPVFSVYRPGSELCDAVLTDSIHMALTENNIENVVIGAQWFGYLSGEAKLVYIKNSKKLPVAYGSKGYVAVFMDLEELIRSIKRTDKNVFLLLNTPIGIELAPRYLFNRNIKNFPHLFQYRSGGLTREELFKKNNYGFIYQDLIKLARRNNITLIEPIEFLCDSRTCPSTDKNGRPIYFDDYHLRPSYVANELTYIDQALRLE